MQVTRQVESRGGVERAAGPLRVFTAWRRLAFFCLAVGLTLCTPVSSSQEGPKSPVPPGLDTKNALKEIKGIYKVEYAKAARRSQAGVEAKRSLARALLDAGHETKDDPTVSYALLDESLRLATECADVELSIEAIGLMTARFDFKPQELQLETFQKLASRVKSADDSWALSHAVRAVVAESIRGDDFDNAQKFVKVAQKAVARSGDKLLAGDIAAQTKQIKLLAKIYSALEKRLAKLEGAGRDLELGRYYAFSKGDWKLGLPLIEKGDAGALGKLAASDAATERDSVEADGAAKLGDGWWDASEKEKDDLIEVNLKLRAGSWYKLAVEGLVPLDQERVVGRLAKLRKLTKSSSRAKESYIEGRVVALSFDPQTIGGEDKEKTCRDLSGHGNNGSFAGGKTVRGKVGGALRLNGAGERVVIAHTDKLHLTRGSSVALWFKPTESIGRGLEETQILFSKGYVERDLSYALLFSDEGDGTMTGIFTKRQYVNTSRSSWPAGEWNHVTLTLSDQDGDFVSRLYINGQLVDTDELGVDPEGTLSNISVGAMDTSGRRPFKGAVDELAIWNRPLTGGEVRKLFQNSSRGRSYCEETSP